MAEPLSVQAALAAVMADCDHVAKRDENTHQNFRFRGIDAVLNAVGPVLRKHGLVVLPYVDEVIETTVEVGRNRSRMGHVTVICRYVFVGPDGSTLESRVVGEAMDSGDKAAPKAMSVAMRTALIQALALPTDEPDPDATSYQRADAPALMTASQQSTISELLASLDEDTAAEVKAWWKAEDLPPLGSGHLTEDDAARVIDRLEHTPAEQGSD